jgi:hypothetical protein
MPPKFAFMLEEPSITKYTVGVMRDARTDADAHVFGSLSEGEGFFEGVIGARPVPPATPSPNAPFPELREPAAPMPLEPGNGRPVPVRPPESPAAEQPPTAASSNKAHKLRSSFVMTHVCFSVLHRT